MRPKFIFIFIVLAAVVAGGVFFFGKDGLKTDRFNKQASWYAVHLNNGQVYFGHIGALSADTIELADTHFLEAYQESDANASQSENFAITQAPKQVYRLVERGDEKTLATNHTLFINRPSVLFWEKLTPESEIVDLINKQKK